MSKLRIISAAKLALQVGIGSCAAAGIAIAAYVMVDAYVDPPRHNNASLAENYPDEVSDGYPEEPILTTLPPRSTRTAVTNERAIDYFHGDFRERIDTPTAPSYAKSPLVVIGCSQSYGAGIDGLETFASLVASRTRLRYLNLSIPGAGSIYSALRLESVPGLDPKIIVYGLYEDHLYRNLRRCALVNHPLCHQLPIVGFDGNGQARTIMPDFWFENLIGGFVSLRRKFYVEQFEGSGRTSYWLDVFWSFIRLTTTVRFRIYGDPNRADRMTLLAALDHSLGRMAAFAKAHDAWFIVVWIPITDWPRPERRLPDDIRSLIEARTDLIVDMAPVWNEMFVGSPVTPFAPFVIPTDGHMNELAHRSVADEVLKIVERLPR